MESTFWGQMITLLYDFYQIYLFYIPMLVIIFVFYKIKHIRSLGIKKALLISSLCIILASFFTYTLYRMSFSKETVTVTAQPSEFTTDVDVQKTTLIRIDSSHRAYTDYEITTGVWLREQTVYTYDPANPNLTPSITISAPAGRNLYLIFKTGPDCGAAKIEYQNNIQEIDLYSEAEGITGSLICSQPWIAVFNEMALKLLCLLAATLMICWISYYVVLHFSDRCYQSFKKHIYTISIFMFLMLQLFLHAPEKLNGWGEIWYAFDYSFGNGSRFLPGAILSLISGDYLYARVAYLYVFIVLSLICLILSILLGSLMKKKEKSSENYAFFFLVFAYLASPSCISYLWKAGNMGKLETFPVLFVLLAVLIFSKVKPIAVRYLSLTLLAVLSMAAYHGYLFLYFPILFALMTYDVLKDHRFHLKECLYSLFCCVSTAVSFFYFQFYSGIRFENEAALIEYVSDKTDLTAMHDALHYEYFSNVSDAYRELCKGFLTGLEYPREKTFVTFLLLLPLILVFVALWMKVFELLKKNKKHVFMSYYFYMLLSTCLVLPNFILNVDWSRWFAAILSVQFFFVLYLGYQKAPEMTEALHCLTVKVKKNQFLIILFLLYLACLSKFGARDFLPETDQFFRFLFEHRISGY
ncbi:MAG: hypothetical protein GX567_07515 [Clostridia bacterium]|nr:hypothetical protein [Clostridia bacterium]